MTTKSRNDTTEPVGVHAHERRGALVANALPLDHRRHRRQLALFLGGASFAAVHTPNLALAVTARVDLGSASAVTLETLADAETPNGTFYFAAGDSVKSVTGAGAPVAVVHTSGKVLALAATSGDLYVQTGLDVAQYVLPGAHLSRSWALTPNHLATKAPPTESGLLAAGSVVWSWDDWATDASGFEYATLDELTAAGVRTIDTNAYPADMAADASGLYYEGDGYLAHITPTGARTLSKHFADADAPMALSSGSIVLFAVHEPAGTPYLDRFSEATLAEQGSVRETTPLYSGAATSAGLLAIACSTASCTKSSVWLVDPVTATSTVSFPLPGLVALVEGTAPAVLAVAGGHGYLVRFGTVASGSAAAPVLGSASFDSPAGRGWGSAVPASISNGGDPSGIVTHITWSHWGSADAYATGQSSITRPTFGYYSPVSIELRASDLGHCKPSGPLAYRLLAVREPFRPGGPLGAWTPWGGSGSICLHAS